MNRWYWARGIEGKRPAALALAGFGLLLLAGCLPQQIRAKSEDESERERYDVRTVGDVTMVGNAEPRPVGGVGLVTGLEGTGGDTAHDGYREMLEEQLRKEGVRNIKDVLTSRNHALVLITAVIPPGAHKGQPIDLDISLPRGSRVTSLRGGSLRLCKLYNYDFTRHLDPSYSGPNNVLLGHPLVKAEGKVLVGMGDGEESERLRHGRIWGGGRCQADTPFMLAMNNDQQFTRMAVLVGNRINETFQGDTRTEPGEQIATAQDKHAVALKVPLQYQHNHPHYLRVIRFIPLDGRAALGSLSEEGGHRSYRARLGEDLLNPTRTVTAALRLEALGQTSIEVLKRGLSHPHPLVRFCSAESLAYLGCPACSSELAQAVAGQPLFRAFGLTALASIDEAACHLRLHELLTHATDAETRYGAFRALRALNERDPLIQGELLNESFWLHRIAPESPPLIHLSTARRAEIVLFGEQPCLKPPFALCAGDFCVTASGDDTRCTLSRTPLGGVPIRRQCSVKLDDLLRTMADMGATYFEAIGVLQQADQAQALTCRIACDALPQAVSVYDLLKLARNGTEGNKAGEVPSLVPGGQDLGVTPTLYERTDGPASRQQQQEVLLRDGKSSGRQMSQRRQDGSE